MKVYRINDGVVNVIFFKIKPFKKDYTNIRGEKSTRIPYLTFGSGYNCTYNGDLISWNTNYTKCEIIKENNILLKNISYDVKSFYYLYYNLPELHRFELFNFCSIKEKVLLFKGYISDNKTQLIILCKNKFIEFDLETTQFKSGYDFTPKDLKLKYD